MVRVYASTSTENRNESVMVFKIAVMAAMKLHLLLAITGGVTMSGTAKTVVMNCVAAKLKTLFELVQSHQQN